MKEGVKILAETLKSLRDIQSSEKEISRYLDLDVAMGIINDRLQKIIIDVRFIIQNINETQKLILKTRPKEEDFSIQNIQNTINTMQILYSSFFNSLQKSFNLKNSEIERILDPIGIYITALGIARDNLEINIDIDAPDEYIRMVKFAESDMFCDVPEGMFEYDNRDEDFIAKEIIY